MTTTRIVLMPTDDYAMAELLTADDLFSVSGIAHVHRVVSKVHTAAGTLEITVDRLTDRMPAKRMVIGVRHEEIVQMWAEMSITEGSFII